MDNLDKLLNRFKEHLQVRGRSAATITLYMNQTRCFLRAINAGDIRRVNKNRIETYIERLYQHKLPSGKPYLRGTISVKVRAVKRFFEYLEATNRIFINPAETIREPRKQKNLPRHILSADQMSRILDQPDLELMTGVRDRAILEVFYSTGIRLNELCCLTVFDADLQGGMLRINDGKGGKDRVVPMGRHAVRFLSDYISSARPRLTRKNRKERSLFVNRYGHAISRQVVGIIIRTTSRSAGMAVNVTAHTFRHTFAAMLVKNGADIVSVQKMMGHADLKTTQQYIRALGLDLKAVHKRTHPREKDQECRETAVPRIERVKHVYRRKRS
jgi:integrase/recombinase XerD